LTHAEAWRGGSPDETNVHVPGFAPAHVLHDSVQAVLQHTPSTQKLLAHWPLQVHGALTEPFVSTSAHAPSVVEVSAPPSTCPPDPAPPSVGNVEPSGGTGLPPCPPHAATSSAHANGTTRAPPDRPRAKPSNFMVSLW